MRFTTKSVFDTPIVRGTYRIPRELDDRIKKIFKEKFNTLSGSPRVISKNKLIEAALRMWVEKQEGGL